MSFFHKGLSLKDVNVASDCYCRMEISVHLQGGVIGWGKGQKAEVCFLCKWNYPLTTSCSSAVLDDALGNTLMSTSFQQKLLCSGLHTLEPEVSSSL